MLDSNDLYNSIKLAAMKAVEASKPSDFLFGKVIGVSPLKIAVDQKLTLGSAQLVLTRNVTDYNISVSIDWKTEAVENHSHAYGGFDTGGYSYNGITEPDGTHDHKIKGEKTITIHNALRIGDEVILLKKKGGQKYLVLDRVVNT